MSSFTKLDSGIIHSSLWQEDAETRIVWITLLAMAGPDHCVHASVLGLAHAARVPIPRVQEALAKFLAPDEWSRTKDYEGRRIQEVEGGWLLLNHERIRDGRTEYQRDYMARYRSQGRDKSRPVNPGKPSVNSVSQGKERKPPDADTDSDNTPKTPKGDGELFVDPVEQSFNAFWNLYPRKAAKRDALKAWSRVSAREHPAILIDLQRRTVSPEWRKEGGKFVPLPATYLRGERWKDEVAAASGPRDVSRMTAEEILREAQR